MYCFFCPGCYYALDSLYKYVYMHNKIKVRSYRSSLGRIYYKFECPCKNEPSLHFSYGRYNYYLDYMRKDLMRTGSNGVTCTKCWKHYKIDLIELYAEEIADPLVFREKHGVFK